jgi:TfoX-like protein
MGTAKKTAKTNARTSAETSSSDVPAAFERIAETLRREGGTDSATEASRRQFGSAALKVGGKIFAMAAQGTLVLKLPESRVDALVAAGRGTRFDPGHGRLMKEWVSLHGAEDRWLTLAREARAFVSSRAK